MNVAIPIADGRISPVFDAARRVLLVEVDRGREVCRTQAVLAESAPLSRAQRITELHVDVLICGAISRPLEATLAGSGVEVIPRTCGQVEEVLQAYMNGELTDRAFLMPGSSGRWKRRGATGDARAVGWDSNEPTP